MKTEQKHKIKMSADHAKSELMRIANLLESNGFRRDSSCLETIIARLEAWQNR